MILLLGHSILPLGFALAILFGLTRLLRPSIRDKTISFFGRTFWVTLSVCLLGIYGAALAFRMCLPVSMDFVEATVVCLSYLALHGHPIYVGLADPNRYSIMYGPLCYFPYSASLFLFGSSLRSLEVMVLLSNVSLFVVLWLLFRRILGKAETLVAMAFVAAALMMKSSMTFMIRGDVLLALSVAVALYACSLRHRWLAIALFVAAGAATLDIKITGVFYLLMPAYLFWRRQGRRASITALLGIILLSLLPFAIPSVSLPAYLLWLGEASHHPLSPWVFGLNLFTAILAVFPPCLLLWRLYCDNPGRAKQLLSDRRGAVLLLFFSLGGSVITGSKVGAGRYHLNPTFIVCAFVAAVIWSKSGERIQRLSAFFTSAFVVYAVFLIVPASSELQDMWSLCVRSRHSAQQVNADISAIVVRHPGQKIEMGYSDNPADGEPVNGLTTFRPLLVMAGNPLTVDVGALLDMQLSGVTVPRATVEYLRSCKTQIWLIPKGGEPFSMLNGYAKVAPNRFHDKHLFTPEFREAFKMRYIRKESSRFFDLWECEDGGEPASAASRPAHS